MSGLFTLLWEELDHYLLLFALLSVFGALVFSLGLLALHSLMAGIIDGRKYFKQQIN
jgi:hypothetical protein